MALYFNGTGKRPYGQQLVISTLHGILCGRKSVVIRPPGAKSNSAINVLSSNLGIAISVYLLPSCRKSFTTQKPCACQPGWQTMTLQMKAKARTSCSIAYQELEWNLEWWPLMLIVSSSQPVSSALCIMWNTSAGCVCMIIKNVFIQCLL
jgi:hypothetical protein